MSSHTIRLGWNVLQDDNTLTYFVPNVSDKEQKIYDIDCLSLMHFVI